MLRIAVPNKGSLSDATVEMLREAGYRTRRDSKELVVADAENDVEFFYLRPRDIAVYVGSGTVDAGVTGRDLLLDSGSDAVEVMALGFGASTFRYAGKPRSGRHRRGHRGQARRDVVCRSRPSRPDVARLSAEVVRLDGAVETAITLGVADCIADVVETGTTLRQQGLEVFGEPILQSEAVLIRGDRPGEAQAIEVLQRRIAGVITARTYVMLDYDCPKDLVDRACELTPGLESPTVSPMQDEGWVAVRAMVPAARAQPAHGRALRPRGAGDPRHRHRRLPAVTRDGGRDRMTPQSGSHQAPDADSGSARWRPSDPGAAARWRSWWRGCRSSSSASSRSSCRPRSTAAGASATG